MKAPTRWFLAALLVVGALAVAASLDRSAAGAPDRTSGGSLPVTAAALVCPMAVGSDDAPLVTTVATVGGAVPGRAGDRVTTTLTPLRGVTAKPDTLPHRAVTRVQSTNTVAAVLLSATGPGADLVAADQRRLVPATRHRGLISTPCRAPGVDWWLTGADGRIGYDDLLVLSNPGSTPANLTVSAWSGGGRLNPPKLQSYTLPARRTVALPVADYAPDAALVTLHVHANSGRVTADVLDHRLDGIRAQGVDWLGPTQPPATDLVIPGFPGHGGPRRVIVTNPGGQDATVGLKLSTESGSFAPAGHPTALVRAGHSAMVDLSESLGEKPGAVLLHSDQPVTASGFSQLTGGARAHPDLHWQAAARPLDGPAVLPDNAPPFEGVSRVFVTAPRGPAKVRVSTVGGKTRTVPIRGGRTVVIDPVAAFGTAGRGPLVLTPVGAAPVYVSRTLYFFGTHGPLMTAEQPSPLPRPVPLPAAVDDLRAALP